MNDDELTAVLEDAGLSPYQAEAYVTLLGLGTASATDVAEACDVPDPRIYDVLRDLEEKGYVETFQQDSLTLRTDDATYDVGGWGARIEDVEATRITVTDVSRD